MAQLTVSGVDDETIKAISELMGEYGLTNRSAVIRNALKVYLKDRDDLPEWIVKELKYDDLLDRNNWRVRVAFMESNMRDFFNEALEKDLPPHPDRLDWAMRESYMEQIEDQVPDEWKDEYISALESELQRYRDLHPETQTEGSLSRNDILTRMADQIKYHDRTDLALEYAKTLRSRDRLPENATVTEMVEEARRLAKKDKEDDWGDLAHDKDHKARQ